MNDVKPTCPQCGENTSVRSIGRPYKSPKRNVNTGKFEHDAGDSMKRYKCKLCKKSFSVLNEEKNTRKPACPHCNSSGENIIGNGQFDKKGKKIYEMISDYHCYACNKRFSLPKVKGPDIVTEKKIITLWIDGNHKFSQLAKKAGTTQYHVKRILKEDGRI